jgi:asparagine synthase (glutamine-hydrolysing)
MCGVCGIYGRPNESQIYEMLETMEHRGKDSVGVYSDNNISLGHCRLSIIDLSEAGKQPMSNEDGTVQLVVNGEIYNYKELRQILESKSHVFKSNSDSEVIIHAYEDSGTSFLLKLRGMYSLALYDKKENKVILARDPMGKKPLYFCYDGFKMRFASEIKALCKAGIKVKVNYDMIPSYLMFQQTMGYDTLFQNVCKVMAGHAIIFTPNKANVWKYWQIDEDINSKWVEPDYAARLRYLLEQSVKLRLQADVPVGVFLSGGIDSSAITALYAKFTKQQIHSFTASFENNSEAKYAKEVSQYLGTKYHEILITPFMVADDIGKITWHHDEPLGDAAIINNYYLSQEASKYVKVVLAGEGGDEVFGGYPWYKYVPYISVMNKIPFWAKSCGNWLLNQCLSDDITNKNHSLRRILEFSLQKSLNDLILYPTTSMSNSDIKWLTGMKCVPEVNCVGTQYPVDIKNQYNQMLVMDCQNLLQKFLMKADKATMANTIEERLPLLDKDIIQFAFSIPTKFKKDKYILRKAVEDLLPKEIVWRKKQGFGTPIGEWLNNSKLKDLAYDRLRHGNLLREICKKESLDKVCHLYASGDYKSGGVSALGFSTIVWQLFVLQVWHDIFFGKS